jgi:hypothetical protein
MLNALLRQAFNGIILSNSKELAARVFDTRLSEGGIFFNVGIEVCDRNFSHSINRRFGLSVKALDRCGTERSGCEQHLVIDPQSLIMRLCSEFS